MPEHLSKRTICIMFQQPPSIRLLGVMPPGPLTSLILKYAGNILLSCLALVTWSWTVCWSPAECGEATCVLLWPLAPWGVASIDPERPQEAPGPLLFKVSLLCQWGSWAERAVQRTLRAKKKTKKTQNTKNTQHLSASPCPHVLTCLLPKLLCFVLTKTQVDSPSSWPLW